MSVDTIDQSENQRQKSRIIRVDKMFLPTNELDEIPHEEPDYYDQQIRAVNLIYLKQKMNKDGSYSELVTNSVDRQDLP